jgi:hypothetical protein
MGGAIDSPNAEQLGYLRREPHPPPDAPTSRRVWLWLALLAAVLLALAVTLLFIRPDTPEIATKAVGAWREIDTPERYSLVVHAEGDEAYRVSYDRVAGSGGGGAHAVRRGDSIVVVRWGNGDQMTCTLTYDPESDCLTAATGSGTFTFERIR